MKHRLAVVTIVVSLAAAGLAAWSVAAPSGPASSSTKAAPAPKLPALPAEVKSRKRWVIGVKCDVPSFGYIDVRGNHAGYDVEIARRFAELAFGKKNRVNFVCVTTPSRIPALTSKRVDIIIATITFTFSRAQEIDFSTPYYGATGRLLVLKDTPINALADIKGKAVVTTRGALYADWIKKCYRETNLLELDTTTSAFLALKDKRVEAFMWDDALLLSLSVQDKDTRMLSDKFLQVPWGIGIRKGEAGMKRWVDAALARLQARNEFVKLLETNVPKRVYDDFKGNVPAPGKPLKFPATPETHPVNICP
jgi:polar amino acid transport system substrate-binding protein